MARGHRAVVSGVRTARRRPVDASLEILTSCGALSSTGCMRQLPDSTFRLQRRRCHGDHRLGHLAIEGFLAEAADDDRYVAGGAHGVPFTEMNDRTLGGGHAGIIGDRRPASRARCGTLGDAQGLSGLAKAPSTASAGFSLRIHPAENHRPSLSIIELIGLIHHVSLIFAEPTRFQTAARRSCCHGSADRLRHAALQHEEAAHLRVVKEVPGGIRGCRGVMNSYPREPWLRTQRSRLVVAGRESECTAVLICTARWSLTGQVLRWSSSAASASVMAIDYRGFGRATATCLGKDRLQRCAAAWEVAGRAATDPARV